MPRRIALNIQYEGTHFCGWQRQSDAFSVQQALEEAIASLDPFRPIKTVASGRTDAGVHASGQVVHFDCSRQIPSYRWASALNGRLPQTVRVIEAVEPPKDWHACYSAKFRRYRYTIYNGRRPNLFLTNWSWHRYRIHLDESLMRKALEGIVGTHDFGAFERAGSQRAHSFTTIQEVQLERNGDLLILEIQASGFLYGMVRLLVGQLVSVGEHKLSLKIFEKRWKEKRRSEVKESAPAKGLCLIRVGYSEKIFSEPMCFDSAPKFLLNTSNPPSP